MNAHNERIRKARIYRYRNARTLKNVALSSIKLASGVPTTMTATFCKNSPVLAAATLVTGETHQEPSDSTSYNVYKTASSLCSVIYPKDQRKRLKHWENFVEACSGYTEGSDSIEPTVLYGTAEEVDNRKFFIKNGKVILIEDSDSASN